MNNPFEVLNTRLSNIESLLQDIRHKSEQDTQSKADPDKRITVNEFCERYGLSKPTCYKCIQDGMKSEKIGRSRRIRIGDAEEYLAFKKKGGNYG